MNQSNRRLSLKNRYRPLAIFAVASCSWANVTLAQDAPATGGEASGSGSGSGSAKVKNSPFAYDSGGSSGSGATRKVGVNDQPFEGETAGAGAGTASQDDRAGTFVVPGFYGRGSSTITPGKGEFAGPKFRYGVSVGLGYDSNPNLLPSNGLPAVAQASDGSGFAWVNGHFDAVWLKPRTALTVSAQGGASFFFNNSDATQANAQLALTFVHQFDPRTQLSANVSLAYLPQPDFGNLFASQSIVGGDFITGSAKFDLSHRWTPLFSTTTSASLNFLQFVDANPGGLTNNFLDYIFGNQFRFHVSPRVTLVAEGRYDIFDYYDNTALNTQTALALAGFDWAWTRRLTSTFRAGAAFTDFDSGGSATSPYLEASLNYVTGRHSSLNFNTRYGYEATNIVGGQNEAYRLGLLYQRAFTSRFSGNAGFNLVLTDFNANLSTGNTSAAIYDLTAGLQYRIDRHFSVGARYNYTLQDGTVPGQDFDRNRVLFSGQYEY